MILELENNGENNENYERALQLAKRFDEYVGARDTGYFEAVRENERILEELKKLTVTNFTITDYLPMMSDTLMDWRII